MNRISLFATRKNKGCGIEETTNKSPSESSQSVSEKYAIDQGMMFWTISMVSSFVLGSILTCSVMIVCRLRPRRRLRDESELVSSGIQGSSTEFMDEPDVVID